MTSKKWSEGLNMKFIDAYKEQECLWNQFNPLYKNKFARETALKKLAEIIELVDFGAVEAKAKIKALRSTYNLEVEKQKKSEKSGAGLDDVYVPSVKWFKTMKEIMTTGTLKRRTQSNLVPVTQTRDNNESEVTDIGTEPSSVGATSPQSDEDTHVDDPLPAPATPKNTQNSESQLKPPSCKKFWPRSKIQQFAATANQLQKLIDSLNTKPSEQNEWDAFGNVVAAHLKKLTPRRALEAEMKIHSVLNECRMQDLIDKTIIPSHSGSSVRYVESSDVSLSPGNVCTRGKSVFTDGTRILSCRLLHQC
ncbi:uncharacterized protein LOC124365380 [Homalodisca vitripennis]|uniref:uncharacterized protein LOC124365380 n=1 Tax=Homalodisca vitripennis TaxID=197043 RepID=UPI001EEA40D6|nr:uncharacterized protein LOC124365380 [Homalodisca vitripennis]